MWKRWAVRARLLRTEVWAIALAARDPRTPWFARVLALAAVGYALSPIDLVPDFIPVLGQLDDLILVPAALGLARRLVPPVVMAECRAKARERASHVKRAVWIAGAVLVLLWALMLFAAWILIRGVMHHPKST